MKIRNPITGTKSIILSKVEFWVAAEFVGKMRLWNLENPGLDKNSHNYSTVMDSLEEQGLVIWDDAGKPILEPDLIDLLEICKNAKEILLIQTYNGSQSEVVYIAGLRAVLQSPRGSGVLELIEIPNHYTLMTWFAQSLGMMSDLIGVPPIFDIPADILHETQQLIRVGQLEKGHARLLQANLPVDLRKRLENALLYPDISASVTCIDLVEMGDKIRGFFVIQSETDFWLARIRKVGQRQIAFFEPTSAGRVRHELSTFIGAEV